MKMKIILAVSLVADKRFFKNDIAEQLASCVKTTRPLTLLFVF